MLLVGAGINNWGYFYGSWADLVGNGGRQDFAVAAGAPRATSLGDSAYRPGAGSGITSAPVPLSWSVPREYSTRGEVLQVRVPGARTGIDADAYVYLPPQYFLRINKHREFPGVEVFTGYPRNALALVNRIDYPEQVLRAITAHTSGSMVLVMMSPTVVPPRDTECTNVPAGPQTLTYLAHDVPTYLEGLYRIRTQGWGTLGASTGGYCATKIALTNSNVFRAAVSLSGYYHPLSDGTTGSLWGGSTVLRNLNDPEWLLAHQPPPPIAVLTTIGSLEQGPEGISDMQHFLSLVRPPMVGEGVVVQGGAHNYTDWFRILPKGLAFLWEHLRAGVPAG